MALKKEYIKTSLREDGDELITSHYINEVLPSTKQFKVFQCDELIAWAEGARGDNSLSTIFSKIKEHNERQTEDDLIRPILECVGNQAIAQVPLGSDTMDFCTYTGDEFLWDYNNTTAIIESKRYGRIENRYYIRKEDNSDEIYQCLNYLRTVNLTLDNTASSHNVDHVILTDGFRWRFYSKKYTHNNHEFENHFIEFDLEAICACADKEERDQYLKLFGLFLSPEALSGSLVDMQLSSAELELAVTQELREQTFMALEYIATGIWRKIYVDDNPIFVALLQTSYGIDLQQAKEDENERAKLLKLVYDESLVYLLRLLFVLYAEDRNLFNQEEIPKVIKGQGNLLEIIIENGKGIGEMINTIKFGRNDDVKLAQVFARIDEKYNGGLFSRNKHPLLYQLDIDDILFTRAIDNLCRVEIKKKIYTVDFSTISVRELGGIYENLLEYKLAIMDRDMDKMPSIINKKRIRIDVQAGDLYLVNHKGERKGTGSYYTPDLIVEHLVHTALDPQLEKIKETHHDDFDRFFHALTELKICDPAMGSGHMLQSAFSRMIDFIHQTLEEMREDGRTHYVWDREMLYQVRATIARKCIYGVDLNPIAVELAKLVMWMKVFRPDKPFEFFDYNLTAGNSLIGTYDYKFDAEDATDDLQVRFLQTNEEMESSLRSLLLMRVWCLLDMPRDTVDQVHEVSKFWRESVKPIQEAITFVENVKLAQWLIPEERSTWNAGYDELLKGISGDDTYAKRVIEGDETIPDVVQRLRPLAFDVEEQYHPVHWNIAFPHVAVKGGFDVILSNPPWDRIKPTRGEFFTDYIEGYEHMETAAAKRASNELMVQNEEVRLGWERYEQSIKKQEVFYQEAYQYQVVKSADGKKLKGDSNLYKVFLEKIMTILAEGGHCGIVVPDNLNIDNGCTGLRRMLLEQVTIKELIMFENRKKLFDIDSRYKFDVLTFIKKKPRNNATFDAGFYWYDPIWLDGQPDADYIKESEYNKRDLHTKYSYSTKFIRNVDPDLQVIYEFRKPVQMTVFEKILKHPAIGDSKADLWVRTYREFDMTNDADLFRFDGIGWPLYQGGMIHHYNAHFKGAEKFVEQATGEHRLTEKWNVEPKDLQDRTYRIVCRSIAQPTDTRSLICCVLPRGVFFGNSLNAIEIVKGQQPVEDPALVAGVNTILSTFVADFFIRQRIAKNVNAFILQAISMPREMGVIQQLGEMSMPLYQGEDFDAFRGDVAELDDPAEREKLIAKLDARVAHMYQLTYEEYQAVLETFPLVDDMQRNRCLQAYNDWTFSLE